MCVVQSTRFHPKFITEPIGIGFLIIGTDAHHLGSVFRLIEVWFLVIGLIGLLLFNSIERQNQKRKRKKCNAGEIYVDLNVKGKQRNFLTKKCFTMNLSYNK